MVASTSRVGRVGRRGLALVGLTGALMSGIGDMLMFGRSCSGRDFDQAVGMVPPHIEADNRWRSMWNGAAVPARRVKAGTLTGHLGIGLLQWLALLGISRSIDGGRERRIAQAAATAFAVSGVLTHQGCATVILAYQRAMADASGSINGARPSPRTGTALLAVSAATTLGALAAFSGSLAVAERRRTSAPAWSSAVTPFPFVLAALLTFGRLPAPVGGYARPASISIGLMTYFALTAASDRRTGTPRARRTQRARH
jgi:uncharacterized protein DUF6796